MSLFDHTLHEADSDYDHYQVTETVYKGRPARVLFSGDRAAAQSGVALDDKPELLFDYNQRFLELLTNLQPRRVLLIGGGVYTLPMALHQALPNLQLDVVERDPLLTELASQYFNFAAWPGLRIYHQDGRQFLDNTTQQYDVILIDAFSSLSVPRDLVTLEAVQQFRHHLTPTGLVAMNVIAAYRGRTSIIIERLAAAFQASFGNLAIFPAEAGFTDWQAQNLICVAQNTPGQWPIDAWTRFPAWPVPVVEPSRALHDQ